MKPAYLAWEGGRLIIALLALTQTVDLFSLSKVKASLLTVLPIRNVGNCFCPDASTFANVFLIPGPHPVHGV